MHKINWHISKRVVFICYQGDISLDEMKQINEDIKAYLEQGVAPVHVIFDVTEMGNFPKDIREARTTLSHMRHPKYGWVVGYGKPESNRLINFFTTVIANLFNVNAKLVFSLKEAEEILKRIDPTL